jgi:hypothetical protein
MSDFEKDTVNLVRLAISGKADEVSMVSRRLLQAVAKRRPDLAPLAQGVLDTILTAPTKVAAQPLPVDLDSRLELLRRESIPKLPVEPTWPTPVLEQLAAVVNERKHEEKLADAGIAPHTVTAAGWPTGCGQDASGPLARCSYAAPFAYARSRSRDE